MGKLSCKICGTIYPDSAEKCPICGGGRNDAVHVNTAEASVAIAEKKASKGGHFTKANVRKRNHSDVESSKKTAARPAPEQKEKNRSGKGFMLLLVFLILLAVGIAAYICVEYVLPFLRSEKNLSSVETTAPTETMEATYAPTEETDAPAEETDAPAEVRCTSLSIEKNSLTFIHKGESFGINVVSTPFNTTEEIVFISTDPSVAEVDSEGNVRAVGSGEADILITCGNAQTKCHVKCSIVEETTSESSESETKPEETAAPGELVLNREDFTLFFKGDSFQMEAGGIAASEIRWTSANAYVATVSDSGLVKAVHKGETTITAEYKGAKASCVVRCNFPDDTEDNSGSENESSGGNTGSDTPAEYIISHIDVTIYVGGSFDLELTNLDGEQVDVSWISNNTSIASVSGNEVTGVSGGTTTVFCNYGGKTYQCIVRVVNG